MKPGSGQLARVEEEADNRSFDGSLGTLDPDEFVPFHVVLNAADVFDCSSDNESAQPTHSGGMFVANVV